MNCDGLEQSYWNSQIQRVERLRRKIASGSVVQPGRVVPSDEDLVIGDGRRLNATVVFIDISGFSNRPSISESEQQLMLRVLNLFFTEMIRIIEDYGGSVEKNTGDGLMAYFEEPTGGTVGDTSTKRAVACALTMDATNELLMAPVLRATGVPPIQFRTSMDYGPITIARIGAAQRFNANVAIGNVANFASRMLTLVGPNQIALGANAKSRLPALWQTMWTSFSPVSTGWSYILSGLPYPLYLYNGRWTTLI
jgi:adenylate cyclase